MSGARLRRHIKVKSYRMASLLASPIVFMLRVSFFRKSSVPS